MIKTKLIFVDGITGSGKSSTAHYIARQLNKNGIKAKWFYELEKNNPFTFMTAKPCKTKKEYSKIFMEDYLIQIEKLLSELKDNDSVYVVESYMFQDILNSLLYGDEDRSTIFEFYKDYIKIIEKLDPVVIHYYQKDVPTALRKNFEIRGDSWKENRIATKEEFDYCKNRDLKGEEGYINFFQEMSDISLLVYETLDFRKIQIENSAKDWKNYRKQIMDFLDIRQVEEILFESSFKKYCGTYLEIKVHIRDERLCIDTYWPNLKLIQTGEDEFEIEGMTTSIKFKKNASAEISLLEFKGSSGKIFERQKISPLKLSDADMEKFCGNYWSESEKIARKIYLKNNHLYYFRKKHNETRIYPLTETRFSLHHSDDQIEFKLIDGEWNFEFAAKGEKSILFVPDKIDYEAEKKSLTEIFQGGSKAEFKEGRAYAPVLLIDRSNGNLFADFRREDLDQLGIKQNEYFEIGCGNKTYRIFYGAAYKDVPYNFWVAFFDSEGRFKVTRNYRNAARPLQCKYGDRIYIKKSDFPEEIKQSETEKKLWDMNNSAVEELMKKNYSEALKILYEITDIDQKIIWPYSSIAHLTLLDGRYEEAKKIYLKYKDKKILNGSLYFEDMILDDFDDLKQMNLYHPDFDKIKELYRMKYTEPFFLLYLIKIVSLEYL